MVRSVRAISRTAFGWIVFSWLLDGSKHSTASECVSSSGVQQHIGCPEVQLRCRPWDHPGHGQDEGCQSRS